jgi:hypothetical protein
MAKSAPFSVKIDKREAHQLAQLLTADHADLLLPTDQYHQNLIKRPNDNTVNKPTTK